MKTYFLADRDLETGIVSLWVLLTTGLKAVNDLEFSLLGVSTGFLTFLILVITNGASIDSDEESLSLLSSSLVEYLSISKQIFVDYEVLTF